MSGKYVTFGRVRDIEDAKRRKAQESSQPSQGSQLPESSQVPQGRQPSDALQLSEGRQPQQSSQLPQSSQPQEGSQLREGSQLSESRQPSNDSLTRPPADTSRVDLIASLPDVDGYLQLSNALVDHLLPMLTPYEQAIYLRLYRLSHGYRRSAASVSLPALAKKTNVSLTQVKRAIASLEQKGLLTKAARTIGYGKEQGVSYEVAAPAISLSSQGRQPRESRQPYQSSQLSQGHMKERKNKEIKSRESSIYEIRTIAARLFEAHRGEASFDQDRLRQLVREALIGQGRPADAEVIEEAIRGMAV